MAGTGVKIRHRTARSSVVLVTDQTHPRQEALQCNICNVLHFNKTYHLWLDDTGSAIVSTRVLEGLRKAGFPDLDVIETVKNPPAIGFGADSGGRPLTRERVDKENRNIRFFTKRKW
jgi:hypothetical protein